MDRTTRRLRRWLPASALLGLLVLAGLAAGELSGSARGRAPLPPDKGARVDREVAAAASARTAPDKNSDAGRPRATEEAPWPTGIFEDDEAPFPAEQRVVNRWVGVIAGRRVAVYAGSSVSNPREGLVIVMSFGSDGSPVRRTTHPTPVRAGPVRIVAAQGSRLSLAAADGQRLTFDATISAFR